MRTMLYCSISTIIVLYIMLDHEHPHQEDHAEEHGLEGLLSRGA